MNLVRPLVPAHTHVRWLAFSDHTNYGGAQPAKNVPRDARGMPREEWEANRPPLTTTHHADLTNGEVRDDVAEKSSEEELHVRAHEALEIEHDINLPCNSRTVAARAEAEVINETFGDKLVRVRNLGRQVVEELCKLRDIYKVTTEDDLRRILDRELKEANLSSDVYQEQLRKDVFSKSQAATEAFTMTKGCEMKRLVNEFEGPDIADAAPQMAEEADTNVNGVFARQIQQISDDLSEMLDEPALQGINFDAQFYGAKLLCSRLEEIVGEGAHVNYKKLTKVELAEIARLRGLVPAYKSKEKLVAELRELDSEKNFDMPNWGLTR